MTDGALLRLRGVRKSYPGVLALAGVDLDVRAGEVHALLGENGAGKSTLMKVIAGSVVPDGGDMSVAGEPVAFGSPQDALRAGIAAVYQELSLVPSLSVAENVLLGRWPRTRLGLFDHAGLVDAAAPHLARVGLAIDGQVPVARLGMADRQRIEIAKAVSTQVRLLLLDEPTSALSDRESRQLFAVIRDLAATGVGVVYVSHRLPEVREIADRVTVLRDGAVVRTVPGKEATDASLAQLMVGRAVGGAARPAGAADRSLGTVVLRARGLGRPPRLRAVDLELRAGEIVGVFGLVGAGRTRLARTLFGLEPATQGSLEILGKPVRLRSPADAVALGVGYLGEDRASGLVPRMNVAANVTLAALHRVRRGPLLDHAGERRLAQRYVDELGMPGVDRLVATLSGGNQQKVLLARWMCSGARILLLDDPTRGVDVGAKDEVFRLVRRVAGEDVAVLYFTSEIKEARGLCDRVLVMAGGRVVRELSPDASEDQIMTIAGGVHG